MRQRSGAMHRRGVGCAGGGGGRLGGECAGGGAERRRRTCLHARPESLDRQPSDPTAVSPVVVARARRGARNLHLSSVCASPCGVFMYSQRLRPLAESQRLWCEWTAQCPPPRRRAPSRSSVVVRAGGPRSWRGPRRRGGQYTAAARRRVAPRTARRQRCCSCSGRGRSHVRCRGRRACREAHAARAERRACGRAARWRAG
mmetsp:Transcript_30137/g.78221  ORF Transcript_30137/g.78221 Transcript_30137/m.78221 type:complete len:201 (-) Transcript_30137:317-919(-)